MSHYIEVQDVHAANALLAEVPFANVMVAGNISGLVAGEESTLHVREGRNTMDRLRNCARSDADVVIYRRSHWPEVNRIAQNLADHGVQVLAIH
ncbi:hypothetical protein A4U49_06010 [Acidithiobacillus ferrivorans]|uniref:hypothetical protein n=1 Tax=Acidithiobacillus ferrivorans TaxID=160808 RepID=UPI00089400A5|nr:hypothetical protein [Acidithiobacillus ferrivorans]OFA16732.1 hypothetical protein A4U49_06010 [Acidithiobacillus ferrivorans]